MGLVFGVLGDKEPLGKGYRAGGFGFIIGASVSGLGLGLVFRVGV